MNGKGCLWFLSVRNLTISMWGSTCMTWVSLIGDVTDTPHMPVCSQCLGQRPFTLRPVFREENTRDLTPDRPSALTPSWRCYSLAGSRRSESRSLSPQMQIKCFLGSFLALALYEPIPPASSEGRPVHGVKGYDPSYLGASRTWGSLGKYLVFLL